MLRFSHVLPLSFALAACGVAPSSTGDAARTDAPNNGSETTITTDTIAPEASNTDVPALPEVLLTDAAPGVDATARPDVVVADVPMMQGNCPAAPAGVSANAIAALQRENELRTAMGIPCATMVETINTAATRHCNYYVANRMNMMCIANPHGEVSSCAMYVADSFSTRMRMAGYMGSPAMENMHFLGNGASAVQGWVDTVYHRTPVLNPWIRDMGYGSATGCDTADYGVGTATPPNLTASYPYPNQTNVPTSFSGAEGPQPPAPPTGYPSGYPVTLFVRGGSITTHTITAAGSTDELPHMWLPAGGLLRDAYVLYTHRPLTARTTYRVRATGMNAGGPVNFDFTFTTR